MTCPDTLYTAETLRKEAADLLSVVARRPPVDIARVRLQAQVDQISKDTRRLRRHDAASVLITVRDCARTLYSVLSGLSDEKTGFSLAQALVDVASDTPRDDLKPGFFAEIIHWVRGLHGHRTLRFDETPLVVDDVVGREAAILRSNELDALWQIAQEQMGRFSNGLDADSVSRRAGRRKHVLEALQGDENDWNDWHWQTAHVLTDADTLARAVPLSVEEHQTIRDARKAHLPFGVTPFYASLMDNEPSLRDRAVRAQVIPPRDYVEKMSRHRGELNVGCDFMLESDTSPVDLVTRRYPAIAILKPVSTCPQICVYCQRNWEIMEAMAPGALAPDNKITAAVRWIAGHPAIRQVLITGGDPLIMENDKLAWLIEQIAAIPSIEVIRIGSRMPVTMPMRVTSDLADLLGGFRDPGRRDVALVTHVEHPYEVTPELAAAVDRLKRRGIGVYNQQVYSFFVSRRFETAALRMLLRRIGVDPYYTFAVKGKGETDLYRVPMARLLQEGKEEARLLPGLCRSDEPVYNVPGLGKNHLRAMQHRDLLTVLPDGSRIYEFHSWEKNIAACQTYLATDPPILDYLKRLESIGEDVQDYESIWYYF